jgi:hypothetical protein
MSVSDRPQSASQPKPSGSPPERRSHTVFDWQQLRWSRVCSCLVLASAILMLSLPSAGCNLCGTSCSEGITCDGRTPTECAEVAAYGCVLSAPSCVCANNLDCEPSVSAQCATLSETQCATTGLCAWAGQCHRPIACEKIQNDADKCTANGCTPHDECD